MKLTVFLLTAACLNVAAIGVSQNVTFSGKNVSLEKVFSIVKQQTGYLFWYKENDLLLAKPVTIQAADQPLLQFLENIFKNQPLKYVIESKTINIYPADNTVQPNNTPPLSVFTDNPLGSIRGRIIDAAGNPLADASVVVKGAKNSTSTNAEGVFSLNVNVGDVLLISFVGYESMEYKITTAVIASSNQPSTPGTAVSLTITLKRKESQLDEVVVNRGYYTESNRLSTGDITTVSKKDIERQPVSNPLLALEGRVPGLVINQTTGYSGSGVTVQIQGQNSIANGRDPLYIIDGVPYPSQLLYSFLYVQGASTPTTNNQGTLSPSVGNSLSYINPNDIETITILKDADATSIYGSRAANGAIIITTKRGKVGKTVGSIKAQNGWGVITRQIPLLNTQQYLQMRHEAFNNDGLIPSSDYDYDLTFWDTTRYTNWQKELIGGTAHYTDVQASVSGGSVNTQFLVSAGYNRETTVLPGDFADNKGSLHFSLNNSSANQKFKLQLTGTFQRDDNKLLSNDPTQYAIQIAPNAPNLFNEDGTLNWAPLPNGNSTWLNPLAYLDNTAESKTNNLTSNALISYMIIPGLEIKSSFGYNNMYTEQYQLSPLSAYAPESRPSNERSANFIQNTISSWIIEPQLNFKRSISKGKFDMLIGTTIEENNKTSYYQSGSGQNSDLVLRDISSAPYVYTSSSFSTYKYNALFARVNYNWLDRYIINLTGRRDGSSRFGSRNQFHNFGSVGAVWSFSNESFVRDNLPFLSFGKLRMSYGTTGNDQITDYKFLSLYSAISNPGVPYQGSVTLQPNGLANPYLAWEETKKLQFGFELGFVKDRILLNANYYINHSSNELLSYKLPIQTGFSSIAQNFPAQIQNSGWEFTLNTKNVISHDFSWSSSINLTIAKNKVEEFPNLASTPYATQLVVGKPLTLTKLYHFLGVDPTTGIWQVADYKGDPTVNTNFRTDRTVIENRSPTLYGGFQNNLTYKGFELDFLFQFTVQKANNFMFGNGYAGTFYSGPDGSSGNKPITAFNNRWQKPGDIALVEKFSTIFGGNPAVDNAISSDVAFTNASFIRLKNIALSWQFPEKWTERIHFLNGRLFAQGQNLLTFTKYTGWDPEAQNWQSLPPLKVLTVGLQVTL